MEGVRCGFPGGPSSAERRTPVPGRHRIDRRYRLTVLVRAPQELEEAATSGFSRGEGALENVRGHLSSWQAGRILLICSFWGGWPMERASGQQGLNQLDQFKAHLRQQGSQAPASGHSPTHAAAITCVLWP